MTVKSILDAKGRDVVTVESQATLAQAISLLAEKRIGAVVVCDRELHILGILSERDIVRVIASTGADTLQLKVMDAMTGRVTTCHESQTVNNIMEIMTQGRFRHLPVEQNGRLAGIISIGDVVKRRLEEALREADQIREYIATA